MRKVFVAFVVEVKDEERIIARDEYTFKEYIHSFYTFYRSEEVKAIFLFPSLSSRERFIEEGYKHYSPKFWKCKSPEHEFCEYNILNDPIMDHCIYCGQPYERK